MVILWTAFCKGYNFHTFDLNHRGPFIRIENVNVSFDNGCCQGILGQVGVKWQRSSREQLLFAESSVHTNVLNARRYMQLLEAAVIRPPVSQENSLKSSIQHASVWGFAFFWYGNFGRPKVELPTHGSKCPSVPRIAVAEIIKGRIELFLVHLNHVRKVYGGWGKPIRRRLTESNKQPSGRKPRQRVGGLAGTCVVGECS